MIIMIKIKNLLFDNDGDLNGKAALIILVLVILLGGMVATI